MVFSLSPISLSSFINPFTLWSSNGPTASMVGFLLLMIFEEIFIIGLYVFCSTFLIVSDHQLPPFIYLTHTSLPLPKGILLMFTVFITLLTMQTF